MKKKYNHYHHIMADSSNTRGSNTDALQLSLNKCLVLGVQSIRCGRTHAQILLAFLDLQNCNKMSKLFLVLEGTVGKATRKVQ